MPVTNDDIGSNYDQGSAYIFTLSNGVWHQTAKLTASDGTENDLFGYSVAVSGNTALISSPGSAYVYDLTLLTVPSAPVAPGSLAAEFVTQTADTATIQLSWQDKSYNEDGFVLETSTDGFTTISSADTIPTNTTRYTYQAVRGQADSLLAFRLLAYNTIGASPYSNTDTVTIRAQGVNLAPVLAPIGNRSGFVGQAVTFTASATDKDSDQSLTYSLVNAPQAAGINPTTGAFSFTPTQAGNYSFPVRVSDNGTTPLWDEELVQITVREFVRIDCGSPQAVVVNEKSFIEDRFMSGTSIPRTFTTGDIANTNEDVIYRSIRSGDSFAYYIPVLNGRHNVELNFAELYFTEAGQRVFSVNIEGGVPELVDLDVVAQAGGANRALSRSFPVTVTDGNLSIAFSSKVSKAMISAIQIMPVPASSARVSAEALAETESAESTLQVSPNPFSDKLTLTFPAAQVGKVSVSLRDVQGKVVYLYQKEQELQASKQLEVHLADGSIASGLYLLEVHTSDGKRQIVKLIKH